MLTVGKNDLQAVLADFGVRENLAGTEELLRYDYEDDPAGKSVRLMLKCSFADRGPLVVKLKCEDGVTGELMAAQAAFSERLAARSVRTAAFYRAGDSYVLDRTLGGYEVLVTVEDFRPGEITCVTADLAERTGGLLARTHEIARRDGCHVNGPVLFDFFDRNDLFSYETFRELRGRLAGGELARWDGIEAAYRRHMAALAPLRERDRYAVQGDVSNCNLFLTEDGELGLFDFNRCGDNVLFCDAVMQGVFESRLMDYDRELTEEYAGELFARFLRGYHRVKPFSAEELSMLPHMYAVIDAFWLDADGLPPLERIAERIERNLTLEF